MYGAWTTDPASTIESIEPMIAPLPPAPPPTWAGREERVRWCLTNLTPGEKALLYRTLNASGVTLDGAPGIEAREKKTCA